MVSHVECDPFSGIIKMTYVAKPFKVEVCIYYFEWLSLRKSQKMNRNDLLDIKKSRNVN